MRVFLGLRPGSALVGVERSNLRYSRDGLLNFCLARATGAEPWTVGVAAYPFFDLRFHCV